MRAKVFRVLASVLAVAIPSAAGLAAATDTKTFVYTTSAGADSLDPAYCYDSAGAEVIYQCYDNLVEHAGSEDLGKLQPGLAMEVPTIANGLMTPTGRTIKLRIRPGVRFHNGAFLTPADVEYTFTRAMLADPAGGPNWMLFEPLTGVMSLAELVRKAGNLEQIGDMKKVDPAILRQAYDAIDKAIQVEGNAVAFRLPKAYPPFLQTLAKGESWCAIVNKQWMIEHGAWDGKPETWVNWYDQPKEQMTLYEKEMGTGPFKLQAWDRRGGQLIFKRFDTYWKGKAKLETAFIKYADEPGTRILMLKSGEADAGLIQGQFLEQVRGVPGIKIVDGLPRIANTTLLFNWSIPVEDNEAVVGSGKLDGHGVPPDFFADIHVRKAFCQSFDYQGCLAQVAGGRGITPVGPAPRCLPFVNKAQPFYTLDPKKAADEFKLAFGGQLWEKGFKLTIPYNTGNTARQTVARIIASGIESINPKFRIEVQGMDWPTYLTRLRASALPLFFAGWDMDFPDVHNFYHPYMHSAGAFAGYCGKALQDLAKAKFDATIEAGIAEPDRVRRQQIYYGLQKTYHDYAVGMPYVEAVHAAVHRDWVKGYVHNSATLPTGYDFYAVWKEV